MCRASIAALALAHATLAEDWPRWEGPSGDGHIPASMPLPAGIPSDLRPRWTIPIGGGMASPIVAAGRVILPEAEGEREVVRAYDATTGRRLWQADLDSVFRDHLPTGPRATALADEDRVYVQSCRGEFRCLRAADGTALWSVNFVRDFGAEFHGEVGEAVGAARHGYTAAPWIVADHIVVAAGGRPNASVVCLDKRTGRVVWRSQNDPAGYAALTVGDVAGQPTLIAFTAEALIGLEPRSGELLWRCPVQTSFGRHITSPRIAADRVLASSHQAGLFAVQPPARPKGDTLTPMWTTRAHAVNVAPFVVVGHHLYGLGPSRRLMCVDARTGERMWWREQFTGAPLKNDWAGLLVSGDRLLILAGNGRLLMVAADPSEFRLLAGPVEVCGPNWCLPAWDGRQLYVRDDATLRAFELPAVSTSSR
ncbi:MAG: PQQ-binding-like beta-propeller repeat protein [Kiritimatiellae bacterium]|nr:PQQ-binding-like beta-propeller repeat protein [Kiritimatiellia bacterium]